MNASTSATFHPAVADGDVDAAAPVGRTPILSATMASNHERHTISASATPSIMRSPLMVRHSSMGVAQYQCRYNISARVVPMSSHTSYACASAHHQRESAWQPDRDTIDESKYNTNDHDHKQSLTPGQQQQNDANGIRQQGDEGASTSTIGRVCDNSLLRSNPRIRSRCDNNITMALQSSSRASAPSPPSDVTPHHRQHHDILPCVTLIYILSYSTLRDLAMAARINTKWRTAAAQIPSRRGDVARISSTGCDSFSTSPMRRHVNKLVMVGQDQSMANMLVGAASVPYLEILCADIDSISSRTLTHHHEFASSLVTVCIRFDICRSSATVSRDTFWCHVTNIVDCVSRIPSLTDLKLVGNRKSLIGPNQDWCLTPSSVMHCMRRMLRLTTFEWCWEFEYAPHARYWSDADMHVLRSLPMLTKLNICGGEWKASQLRILVADGSTLAQQLIAVDLKYAEADRSDIAQSISRLTSLQSWSCVCMRLIDTSFISRLTNMRTLKLSCTIDVDVPILCKALSSLASLTLLKLDHSQMTSDHLSSFLPSLHVLTSLKLQHMYNLSTFSFMSSLPGRVSTLTLCHCQPFCVSHLRAMPILPSMTSLGFYNTTDDHWDAIHNKAQLLTPGHDEFEKGAFKHKLPSMHTFVATNNENEWEE